MYSICGGNQWSICGTKKNSQVWICGTYENGPAVAIFLTTTHPHYHHTSKTGTPEPPHIENFLKQPPQIHTKNPGAIYPNPPNKENHHTTKSKPPHIHTTTTHPIPGLQNHHTSTIFSNVFVEKGGTTDFGERFPIKKTLKEQRGQLANKSFIPFFCAAH